jgi:hypothetical protein
MNDVSVIFSRALLADKAKAIRPAGKAQPARNFQESRPADVSLTQAACELTIEAGNAQTTQNNFLLARRNCFWRGWDFYGIRGG